MPPLQFDLDRQRAVLLRLLRQFDDNFPGVQRPLAGNRSRRDAELENSGGRYLDPVVFRFEPVAVAVEAGDFQQLVPPLRRDIENRR